MLFIDTKLICQIMMIICQMSFIPWYLKKMFPSDYLPQNFHLISDNLHLRKMVLCSCQKYQISDNPQIIYINLMLTCQILMSDMRIACQIYFNLCITSSYNIHAYSTLVRCEDSLSDLLQIVYNIILQYTCL